MMTTPVASPPIWDPVKDFNSGLSNPLLRTSFKPPSLNPQTLTSNTQSGSPRSARASPAKVLSQVKPPEQVQCIRPSNNEHPDQLIYQPGDVITIINKRLIDHPDGYFWLGAMGLLPDNDILVGLFRSDDVITYIGPDVPLVGASNGIAHDSHRTLTPRAGSHEPSAKKLEQSGHRTNDLVSQHQNMRGRADSTETGSTLAILKSSITNLRKPKLTSDMISEPQNDFRHTGHVGSDGTWFGSLSTIQVPKQLVASAYTQAAAQANTHHQVNGISAEVKDPANGILLVSRMESNGTTRSGSFQFLTSEEADDHVYVAQDRAATRMAQSIAASNSDGDPNEPPKDESSIPPSPELTNKLPPSGNKGSVSSRLSRRTFLNATKRSATSMSAKTRPRLPHLPKFGGHRSEKPHQPTSSSEDEAPVSHGGDRQPMTNGCHVPAAPGTSRLGNVPLASSETESEANSPRGKDTPQSMDGLLPGLTTGPSLFDEVFSALESRDPQFAKDLDFIRVDQHHAASVESPPLPSTHEPSTSTSNDAAELPIIQTNHLPDLVVPADVHNGESIAPSPIEIPVSLSTPSTNTPQVAQVSCEATSPFGSGKTYFSKHQDAVAVQNIVVASSIRPPARLSPNLRKAPTPKASPNPSTTSGPPLTKNVPTDQNYNHIDTVQHTVQPVDTDRPSVQHKSPTMPHKSSMFSQLSPKAVTKRTFNPSNLGSKLFGPSTSSGSAGIFSAFGPRVTAGMTKSDKNEDASSGHQVSPHSRPVISSPILHSAPERVSNSNLAEISPPGYSKQTSERFETQNGSDILKPATSNTSKDASIFNEMSFKLNELPSSNCEPNTFQLQNTIDFSPIPTEAQSKPLENHLTPSQSPSKKEVSNGSPSTMEAMTISNSTAKNSIKIVFNPNLSKEASPTTSAGGSTIASLPKTSEETIRQRFGRTPAGYRPLTGNKRISMCPTASTSNASSRRDSLCSEEEFDPSKPAEKRYPSLTNVIHAIRAYEEHIATEEADFDKKYGSGDNAKVLHYLERQTEDTTIEHSALDEADSEVGKEIDNDTKLKSSDKTISNTYNQSYDSTSSQTKRNFNGVRAKSIERSSVEIAYEPYKPQAQEEEEEEEEVEEIDTNPLRLLSKGRGASLVQRFRRSPSYRDSNLPSTSTSDWMTKSEYEGDDPISARSVGAARSNSERYTGIPSKFSHGFKVLRICDDANSGKLQGSSGCLSSDSTSSSQVSAKRATSESAVPLMTRSATFDINDHRFGYNDAINDKYNEIMNKLAIRGGSELASTSAEVASAEILVPDDDDRSTPEQEDITEVTLALVQPKAADASSDTGRENAITIPSLEVEHNQSDSEINLPKDSSKKNHDYDEVPTDGGEYSTIGEPSDEVDTPRVDEENKADPEETHEYEYPTGHDDHGACNSASLTIDGEVTVTGSVGVDEKDSIEEAADKESIDAIEMGGRDTEVAERSSDDTSTTSRPTSNAYSNLSGTILRRNPTQSTSNDDVIDDDDDDKTDESTTCQNFATTSTDDSGTTGKTRTSDNTTSAELDTIEKECEEFLKMNGEVGDKKSAGRSTRAKNSVTNKPEPTSKDSDNPTTSTSNDDTSEKQSSSRVPLTSYSSAYTNKSSIPTKTSTADRYRSSGYQPKTQPKPNTSINSHRTPSSLNTASKLPTKSTYGSPTTSAAPLSSLISKFDTKRS